MVTQLPVLKANDNLETLRGFAAFFVVFYHLQLLNGLFNSHYNLKFFNLISPNGHLWVLIFFVLSGYVIAVSNAQNLNSQSIGRYLKKRIVRIYPIYLIALLLTLIISTSNYGWFEIAMNFSLMQVLLVAPFSENLPTWSLHYEVIYYLLFIPVSFFKLNPIIILLVSFAIALANFSFYPNTHTPLISSYLFGFMFWISGLCIARYTVSNEQKVNYTALIGSLFLLMAINEILVRSGLSEFPGHVFYFLFHHKLLYPKVSIISQVYNSCQDLVFLPYCIYVILLFAGRKIKYMKQFYLLLQLVVLTGLIMSARDFFILHNNKEPLLHFFLSVFDNLMSIVVPFFNRRFFETLCGFVIKFGAWTGGISYAVYILHFPLIFAFGRFDFFNGSLLSYIVRFIVFMAVLTCLAYILERKLQPLIKKALG